ncbi:hypothetical protein BDN71DRAFT_1488351 [Pleurotus eryngii]|uniref:Phytanoyl-CoA dioxygenase family protein n=1 Tax=Pleurotus eryngii TaxID=5323 RepID=A0A9P6DGN8_PLEER|nr:hypothetical protein BDN71DRAFT_1488351 [Pleurotus eryngii]
MSGSIKDTYDNQGFVVLGGLIPSEDFDQLKAACAQVIFRTRNGEWVYRRTVGKQFPLYGDDDLDSWGVQHVMHPNLCEPAFAKWYCSDALIKVVTQLLVCDADHLQMELFNLLINPVSHNFALRWHCDDVSEKATEQEEQEALAIWHHGVSEGTLAALYEDRCLYIVPGSHKQPRTSEQRFLSSSQVPPENPLDMPGAIQVILHPGDSVFYNSNILHCATYDSKTPRTTLHACMGDSRGGSTRARNILQHGLKWMTGTSFYDTLDARGKAMLSRLLDLHKSSGGHVGYSLDG